MAVSFEDATAQRRDDQSVADDCEQPIDAALPEVAEDHELDAMDVVLGLGEPQRVGKFRFFLDGQRWEWSDTVARMHGYEPGQVEPTTELLLQHKHPEDRERVDAVLQRVMSGEQFSSRHRIVDAAGRTRRVVVVGDRMHDGRGVTTGTTGFYVDVTESLNSEIGDVLSAVADARAQIEQAKGVLMAAYGITAEHAFEILVWRSQSTNLKLRDFAARFLMTMAGKASADMRTHVDHALLTIE